MSLSELAQTLQLAHPLVALDTETTGVWRRVDRVVQIGIVKLYPDGKVTEWESLVNPTIKIPPEATAIHHITDEMVANAPTFAQIADNVSKGLRFVDFCGFNLSFDLDMLAEEFRRVQIPVTLNGRRLDGNTIYHTRERRTLVAAAKRYLGEEFDEDAHDALRDARMSMRVVQAQLEEYKDIPRTVEEAHKVCQYTHADWIDPEGKLSWRYGEPCLNFGAHGGELLRDVEPKYRRWVLSQNFSEQVKAIVTSSLQGKILQRDGTYRDEVFS